MHAARHLRFCFAAIAAALTAACVQVPQRAAPAETQVGSAAATAPGAATRGTTSGRISIRQWPYLTIDDKPLQAAPGARIFSSGNLMMTPNMLPDGARVEYELDAMGQVRLIRVLPPK